MGQMTMQGTAHQTPKTKESSVWAPSEPYVGPWTTLQAQLAEVFEQALGRGPISIREDLRRCGLTGMIFQSLAPSLAAICGKPIKREMLDRFPNIEALARAIVQSDPPECMRTKSGDGRPFFYLHGDIHGGGYYCSQIAAQLDPGIPFHGLPPKRFAGNSLPTMAELAASSIDFLRKVQPNGPYLLGGFCAGALIAYEMAQQLQSRGEASELFLVNPVWANPGLRAWRKAVESCGRLRGWTLNEQLDFFHHGFVKGIRLKQLSRSHPREWAKVLRRKAEGVTESLCQEKSRAGAPDVMVAYLWIMANHRLRPFNGRIHVFSAEDPGTEKYRDIHVWKSVSRDVVSYPLPGNQLSSLTRHAHVLGASLNEALGSARERLTEPTPAMVPARRLGARASTLCAFWALQKEHLVSSLHDLETFASEFVPLLAAA